MKHGLRRWVWEYKRDLLLLSVCIVPLLLYLKRTYLGGVDCLWQWHYRSWFDLGLPLRLQSGKFKWMDVSGTRIHQDWHLIGCDTCQTSKCGPKHTILALIPFWWILTGGRILALKNQSWFMGLDSLGHYQWNSMQLEISVQPASDGHCQYSIFMNLCIGCSFSHRIGCLSR